MKASPHFLFGCLLAVCLVAPVAAGQQTASPPSLASGDTRTASAIVSSPDRPNLTSSADPTQPGVVEVEYGWTRQCIGGGLCGGAVNGRLRLGLTNDLDVSWGLDQFSHAPGGGAGIGDAVLATRYRFFKQSKHRPSIGLAYRLKLPVGNERQGLSTGYADHQAALLISKDLGQHHFDFNVIRTFYGCDGGYVRSTVLALAYSRSLVGHLGTITEFSGTVQPVSTATGTFVLTYRLTPRLVLDGGMDVGLTAGAPRKRLVAGVTYAIGRLHRPKRIAADKPSRALTAATEKTGSVEVPRIQP